MNNKPNIKISMYYDFRLRRQNTLRDTIVIMIRIYMDKEII